MRLLLLSLFTATGPYGYSRVVRGVTHGLRRLGHDVRLLGADDLVPVPHAWNNARGYLIEAHRRYIQEHAREFDVVDYDHEMLPYPRGEFDPNVLMVARSALLTQHAERIKPPSPLTLRSLGRTMLRGPGVAAAEREKVRIADVTVRNADLVNVSNEHDRVVLERRGLAPERVVVLPYAIAPEIRASFVPRIDPPRSPEIVFLGTFDYRKGATHMPGLLRRVAREVPAVRLRILGSKGLFATRESVLSFFPSDLRARVDVEPTFDPTTLPARLADASLGIFPSYWEGFPFAVLEQMAVGIPVIAFDAPGAPMLVPKHLLVPPGDGRRMADLAVDLLRDRERLRVERQRAADIAKTFEWEDIARRTLVAYEGAIARFGRHKPAAGASRAY